MAIRNCVICGELMEYAENAQKYCYDCQRLLENKRCRRKLVNRKTTPADDNNPTGPKFRKAKCPRCGKFHPSIGNYTGNVPPRIPCNECRRYFQEHSEQTVYEVVL